MGWWWSNGSSKKAEPSEFTTVTEFPTDTSNTILNDQQATVIKSNYSATPPLDEASRRALTRDEQSERELISWLRDIESPSAPKKPIDPPQVSKSTTPSEEVQEDISPDSLYPTSIACRSALDYAMFCQSFGGQFVNVYRYGTFRSCSNHWQDFWLCMRTRNWEEKDRKKAIQDHFRQRAVKWKTGASSEDVWEVRTEPVKDAFQGDLEETERRIAAWKEDNPDAKLPWENTRT